MSSPTRPSTYINPPIWRLTIPRIEEALRLNHLHTFLIRSWPGITFVYVCDDYGEVSREVGASLQSWLDYNRPAGTSLKLLPLIRGCDTMAITHGNGRRRGFKNIVLRHLNESDEALKARIIKSGRLYQYPQETNAELVKRDRETGGGDIEIEPPLPLEEMTKRPLMLAQYLLDAWIVRDAFNKTTWPSNDTPQVLGIIDAMRSEFVERIRFESAALGVEQGPLELTVRYTAHEGGIMFTFLISDHLLQQNWLQFGERE